MHTILVQLPCNVLVISVHGSIDTLQIKPVFDLEFERRFVYNSQDTKVGVEFPDKEESGQVSVAFVKKH
jgi:hypothetical protein